MSERLKRILDLRYRISTQLYIALGGAVVLTIAASLVGWFSFNSVGSAQGRVNDESVPSMAAAFGVARYGGILAAAAPSLTASETRDEFAQVSAGIADAHDGFEEELGRLQSGRDDERFDTIRSEGDLLVKNIRSVESSMLEGFELAERTHAVSLELSGDRNQPGLRAKLESTINPAIDDQFFYTITGFQTPETSIEAAAVDSLLPEPRDTHFSEAEIARFRYLSELQAHASIATQLLASAFTLSNADTVEPLRERFESSAGHIERNLESLKDSPLHAELDPLFARLLELGLHDQNAFDLSFRALALSELQAGLLADNRRIAVDLVEQVDGLVAEAQLSAEEATLASEQAVLTGRTLLLAISGISIGGAVLLAWLFVGRVLLRRLAMLSSWMRRMADGDLETTVEIEGRDEVADMAAALEVFRRHALEVQRLNLVEKLAEELQGKNEELEGVLAELQTAQDQIVMREKLAALGELTAGVAHEIRNPLNFVKNFSQISGELLGELQETLDENDGELTQEQRDLIKDISDDLKGNLERIQSHGDRANRIVNDMLSMSRGPGAPQPTDINQLLEEHARLAYHSVRATDPDFQLHIEVDLDPEMGELEVISQDLGRVFLNMVSNACYATDEMRRANEASGDGGGYMPTLSLTTRRTEERCEIGIRDNGSGMPPEVIEKIFNPFFTTKPTDKGTGLGLSLCNDIVRQHGGSIRVDSAPGEFTLMTVELPLTGVAAVPADEADAPVA